MALAPTMAIDHSVLDRPIWAALTTGHRALAEGSRLAWRYPAEIAPFAAMLDASPEAFQALRALIPLNGLAALFTLDKVEPPPGLEIQLEAPIYQMISTGVATTPGTPAEVLALGGADAADMLLLAELTRPGPFGPRTHELGDYIGIRIGGRLAAMAGERMRLDHHVEISAVCVHPDHRGKGYARILVECLMHRLVQRGITPFLHVFAGNMAAIALYRQLGFVIRQNLHVTRLGLAAAQETA